MRVALAAFILIFFTAAANCQTRVTNDPTRLSVGARPLGLGKTFTAIADDPSAIFLNPAGLGTISNWQISSMSGKFVGEVDYVQLTGLIPTGFGVIGIGYGGSGISFRAPSPEVIVIGGEEKIIPSPSGTVSYSWSNTALLLSYGRSFRLPNLFVGGSLKLYSQRLSGSTITPASALGLNLDLGALYRPLEELSLGAALQNVLPASLGGGMKWDTGAEEYLPLTTKLGLSYHLLGEEGKIKWQNQELSLSFDFETQSGRPSTAHFGIEWTPLPFISLRLGQDGGDPTYGIGVTYDGYRFDYTYHTYYGLSSAATNYFSLSYGIFKEKKLPPPPPPPPKKVRKLVSFVDVPEGYWAKEPIEELATLGIITGYPDGTFRPEGNITRAEMCALLIKSKKPQFKLPDILIEMKGAEIKEESVTMTIFKDVPANHWAAAYIAQAVAEGIVKGYPGGLFKPGGNITRAEGVIMITRFAELKKGRLLEAPFPDVPGRHWAAPEITAAKEAGLLKYLEGKNFEPNRLLTRAEAAEILFRTPFVQRLITI